MVTGDRKMANLGEELLLSGSGRVLEGASSAGVRQQCRSSLPHHQTSQGTSLQEPPGKGLNFGMSLSSDPDNEPTVDTAVSLHLGIGVFTECSCIAECSC